MKRSASDVLRRGFDSLLANWPLLLIRIGEGFAMLAITIAAVIAAIVPAVISAVRSEHLPEFDPERPEEVAAAIIDFIGAHWGVIAFAFVVVLVLLTVILAVHSFFEGATTRVFVDAERYAATRPAATREDFRMFTVERWFAGGSHSWWRIFWIYNLAWTVGLAIMLLPFAAIALLVSAMQASAASIVLGCLAAAIGIFGVVLVGILITLWNAKAVVVCVARGLGAAESLRVARRELRDDFGRHFGVAAIVVIVAFGASGVLSMFGFGAMFGGHHAPGIGFILAPLQLASSFAQTAISAAIGCWFTACYAALTTEP